MHHITFIQRYLDINCGFKFWAVVLTKKEMIVVFAGFNGTNSSQVAQLRIFIII